MIVPPLLSGNRRSIVQLKDIRFDNHSFNLNRQNFTVVGDRFRVPPTAVDQLTPQNIVPTTELPLANCSAVFPGRGDVVRLLMEPITYANGSTLRPALTYGTCSQTSCRKTCTFRAAPTG